MRFNLLALIVIVSLVFINDVRTIDWLDYDPTIESDSNEFITALTRDQEQEIYSPFITGYKYVSGGAGEGRQHLSPNGDIPNRPEVKTDEELPSFCDPPNPCPLDFEADDCDTSPMSLFTAEYSQLYQLQQNCQCDKDHDQCPTKQTFNNDQSSKAMLKRSRRLRRNTNSIQQKENDTKNQQLQFHLA